MDDDDFIYEQELLSRIVQMNKRIETLECWLIFCVGIIGILIFK